MVSWYAACSVHRACHQGNLDRLIVNMELPSTRRTLSRPIELPRQLSAQQLFGDGEDETVEDVSPEILLACYKLAIDLGTLGMSRVRFVTQSPQTAVRLRQVIYYHSKSQGASSADSDRIEQRLRISVLGMGRAVENTKKTTVNADVLLPKKRRSGGGLHYGLAVDDQVIVVVAPSAARSSRPVYGNEAGAGIFGDLDAILGAAQAIGGTPVVLINPALNKRAPFGGPRAQFGPQPYLLRGFVTAFEVLPAAFRRGGGESVGAPAVSEGTKERSSAFLSAAALSAAVPDPVSVVALLRQWPHKWEGFLHQPLLMAENPGMGSYVCLGSFGALERPSASQIKWRLDAFGDIGGKGKVAMANGTIIGRQRSANRTSSKARDP